MVISKRFRWIQLFLALTVVIALNLSCSSKKGVLDGEEYVNRLNAFTSVYIMPADFSAFVLSPQTKSLVPDQEVSDAISLELGKHAKKLLTDKGYSISGGIPPTMETDMGISIYRGSLISYRDANKRLLALKARKKSKGIRMALDLPGGFGELTSGAGVSLFINGQARIMGKGEYGKKLLKETGKSALITAATLGFIWSIPNVGSEARASFSAALVDNRTGAILWHSAKSYSADLKRKGAAQESLDKLLKNLKPKARW